MSGFTDPTSGETTYIFGRGGGRQLAETYEMPFLGAVPIDTSICENADGGEIGVVSVFEGIVERLVEKCG